MFACNLWNLFSNMFLVIKHNYITMMFKQNYISLHIFYIIVKIILKNVNNGI